MIGPCKNPDMHTNGGETRGMIRFAWNLCRRFSAQDPSLPWLAKSGEALLKLNGMLKDESRCLSPSARQEAFRLYMQFVACYGGIGGVLVPEHHAACHMFDEICTFGNPRSTATWQDESDNGADAKLATISHPMTFSLSFFQMLLATDEGDCLGYI